MPRWEANIRSNPSKDAFSETGHLPYMLLVQGHIEAARRSKTSKATETSILADPPHRASQEIGRGNWLK